MSLEELLFREQLSPEELSFGDYLSVIGAVLVMEHLSPEHYCRRSNCYLGEQSSSEQLSSHTEHFVAGAIIAGALIVGTIIVGGIAAGRIFGGALIAGAIVVGVNFAGAFVEEQLSPSAEQMWSEHLSPQHIVESIYSLTPKKLLQKVFQRFSVVFDVLNNILKI